MKDVDDLRRFLPGIALFGGLNDATMNKIISMLAVHQLEPGSEICQQGEVGRSMFVVRSGEALVYRTTETGKKVKMVRLGEGEFFGEMTLIDIQKRSASVVVEKPTVLLSLGNRDLLKLYNEDMPGYVMVIQNLCRELSRRLRKTNARLSELAEEADEEGTQMRTQLRPAVKVQS